MRILIADDDPPVCEALREVLTAAGYGVACVGSGAAACERLDREGFALVISDWSMPGGGGAAVVAHARRHHPGLPIVILSGQLPAESAIRYGFPVVAQLEKPISARSLLAVVREVAQSGPAAGAPR